MKIYLASKSPRRRELLTQMGVPFEILPLDTPEIIAPNESPETYSVRVTKEKMDAAWAQLILQQAPLMPVLCADTEVVLNNQILGKPRDEQDAFDMLKSYSGKAHQVLTSVGIHYFDYQKIITNTTIVHFTTMSDNDIKHYLALGDYNDKAGAYGIQSYIGQFISKIDGCFYSVMGLPLSTVRLLMQSLDQHLKAN